MKIGIVGHGFVGKAVDYGFETPLVEKFLVDPIYGTTLDDLKEFNPDAVFICLPTPMGEDGSVDASLVTEAVHSLGGRESPMVSHRSSLLSKKLIIIKSTVTPDIVGNLCTINGRHYGTVYNPEFLTEKSSQEQFISPPFHIFGGPSYDTIVLEQLYIEYSNCNECPIYHMTGTEAAFVKYGINSFLAMKVTFFNQLYDAIGDEGNFNLVIRAMGADPRIGTGHTKVPGFDSKRGFGGACFPKDTKAFTEFSDKLSLLEKVTEINNEYRSQYEKDEREQAQNIKYDV